MHRLFRKKVLMLMFFIVMMILTSCGQPTDEVEGNTENNGDELEESTQGNGAPDDAEIVITFSHNQATDTPEHVGAETFKETIESASDGRVFVDIYPASQLGSLREQTESTQIGEIDITMQPTAVVSPFVEDIGIVDLPYLWPKDYDALFEVQDGDLGNELLERLEQGQFHGLGLWFQGFKLITTDGVEIHEPSDFEGLSIRTMEAPVLLSQYEAWGGNPVPVPYAEVYNALQQGVVDGQENPLQTIIMNNYHEVQDTIIQSYHGTMTYVVMANKAWFDGLPEDIQQLVEEAELAGRKAAREALMELEAGYIEELQSTEGINYYELTDEEIDVFREVSLPVHEEHFDDEWQTDFLQRLYKAIEEATSK